MNKLLITLAIALLPASAWADLSLADRQPAVDEGRDFGIGLIVGDPTALTLKGMLSGQDALQAHAGWRLGDPDGGRVTLIVDYLRHFVVVDPVPSSGEFSPFIGIGGKLGVGDGEEVFGPRLPVGLGYFFGGAPVELSLEVAPGIAVLPETSFMVDAGLAARWYF